MSVSKEEYLKRYLSDDQKSKKLKKRKKKIPDANLKTKSSNTIRIFDDDVDIWHSRKNTSHSRKPTIEVSKESSDDEAPAIAQIVDDRPLEIKRNEFYGSEKWQNFGHQQSEFKKEIVSGNMNQLSSESDHSPVRRSRHDSSDTIQSDSKRCRRDFAGRTSSNRNEKTKSNVSRSERHDSSSDASPPRKQKHISHSNKSPAKKEGHNLNKDTPLGRKRQFDSDSDVSPPRKGHDSGSDISSPGKLNRDLDSDISPPRKARDSDSGVSPPRKLKRDSDSDVSPPRKTQHNSDRHPSLQRKCRKRSDDDDTLASKKLNVKQQKTLAGTKAGLQDAKSMKQEISVLRKQNEKLSKMDADKMDAMPQIRKSTKLKIEKNIKDKEEKEKREEILKERYSRWGKGLKQSEMQEDRLQETFHEMSKPLSRYEGDEDLERHLKDREDVEDPMFEYMRKKKQKSNKENSKSKYPVYSGPAPPPARFNIHPGYRWDGVDRSNGFERKIIMRKANKEAKTEEIYKWSIEDM